MSSGTLYEPGRSCHRAMPVTARFNLPGTKSRTFEQRLRGSTL